MSAPRITIKTTNDGSHTLHTERFDADYHSIHGARQEALHVYIKHGLLECNSTPVNILEIGFGTGLNALLTLLNTGFRTVHYTTLEPYPLDSSLVQQLNYTKNETEQHHFTTLHTSDWHVVTNVTPSFSLEKKQVTLENFTPEKAYDLVYYDAFGPNAQPELWTDSTFKKLYSCMTEGSRLVTFCAQGEMKRALKRVGFTVTALPGPPGKREMTVAKKVILERP
jgi:tRNA U34 5-methylaminomethyl-2-thiouridine-forming methyltransferase MnmC